MSISSENHIDEMNAYMASLDDDERAYLAQMDDMDYIQSDDELLNKLLG